MSPMTYSGASCSRTASRRLWSSCGVRARASASTRSECCATEKMWAPRVWPFQRATRASPCAISSISTSSADGSRRSRRRPDSMRCQARGEALDRVPVISGAGYPAPDRSQAGKVFLPLSGRKQLRRSLLAPEPPGGNVGAFAQRFELQPHHILGDPFPAREGAKAAIDAGDHAFAVAGRCDRGLDALRDLFGMLDQIDLRVDDARDQDHIVRELVHLQRG